MPFALPAWFRRRRRWYVGALCAMLLLLLLDWAFPPPIPDLAREGSTIVLAADGTPLRAFATTQGIWRYPVRLEEVSPLFLDASLGYEDRWFYRHPGVNPLALVRALGQALKHREVVSGGSTLTMQVARLIEPMPRNVLGKAKQIVRALQLERRLSKSEILTLYLNLAPYGGTIEGVQAASWAYLGKSCRQLSHAEAALLAVLPQAPSKYRPDRQPDVAKQARNKVLKRLADLRIWPQRRLREAQLEPVVARNLQPPLRAALLADRLHRERPGARAIKTFVDPLVQQIAEQLVAAHMGALPQKTSAAVLAIDNRTMQVKAYVGSAKFADDDRLGHVDMIAAIRSPGSTLKPFLYAMALEDGYIHSESLLVDAPQSFDGYRPANFGEYFNGPVGAAEALRLSLNVPAVFLLTYVTPKRFAAKLSHVGVALRLPRGAEPNLSLVLGGAGTNLEELVGAYAAFARDGVAIKPLYAEGDAPSERRLVSRGAAALTRAVLEAHGRPGESVSNIDHASRVRVAWKTGTSYGFRDSWAIGVTGSYTLGVWIGRPDGTPVPGQYGAITALPLLFRLVDGLPKQKRDFMNASLPPEVSKQDICWPLGVAPDPAYPDLCHEKREAYVLNGIVPPTLGDLRDPVGNARIEPILVDDEGRRVTPLCGKEPKRPKMIALWPVLAQPWLSAAQMKNGSVPSFAKPCQADQPPLQGALKIEGAVSHSVIKAAPGSKTPPKLSLRVLGTTHAVQWLVNGQWMAASVADGSVIIALRDPGEKTIVAIDEKGYYDRIVLDVIP